MSDSSVKVLQSAAVTLSAQTGAVNLHKLHLQKTWNIIA